MFALLHPVFACRPSRRWGVLGVCIAWLAATSAHAQRFDWEQLSALAQSRANRPYEASSDKLPAALQGLGYDQIRDIRWRPVQSLWRGERLPFEVQFFHLGQLNTEPVQVNEIAPDGSVRALAYRSSDYDFGATGLASAAWGNIGHAGFRLHHALNTPRHMDELLVFLGASYFRALGAGQQYGLSARGLAIDTVGGEREEFPRFTRFWLERPRPGAKTATVYALLESPRSTGAYRFTVQPGPETVLTVQARVFLRPGSPAVATMGLAPLTSMFFFGENQPRASDFRPEVHDSDGLMLHSGEGEWLWRPLQNPKAPLVSSFATRNPRGFGLMQRDRRFESYEDLEARYERRPSAWVRPLGDWGAGRVELVQLPTRDETEDNIVAYWVPEELPAPGQPLDFAYELAWQGDDQQRPPGTWVTQSRRGFGHTALSPAEQATQASFVLDFAGPALGALPPDSPVRAIVSTDANGRVLEQNAYPHPTTNPATRRWRVALRVQRLDPTRPLELRAFLQHHQDAVSETWTHLLPPE
jgi:periplasmic glucans biosynthesis protein